MPEGIAQAPHALSGERLQREDDGRAGAAHCLEATIHVLVPKLQDHGGAAQRRRRVAVPVGRFFRERESRPVDAEVRVADCAATRL